jgi:hypothetical protein
MLLLLLLLLLRWSASSCCGCLLLHQLLKQLREHLGRLRATHTVTAGKAGGSTPRLHAFDTTHRQPFRIG